jgi:chromosome partitioning protein
MGSIITTATSRGGAGKTTVTALLSANLAAVGYRVGVVDADPNATFTKWHEAFYQGPAFKVVTTADHLAVVGQAQDLAEGCDVVLVDTAGFGNQAAGMAIATSDGVIIPVMADSSSVREAVKTRILTQQTARAQRRKIPFRVLGLAWVATTEVCRHTLEELKTFDLPVFQKHISRRTVLQQMTYSGVVPVSGRSGAETDQVIKELVELGWIAKRQRAA